MDDLLAFLIFFVIIFVGLLIKYIIMRIRGNLPKMKQFDLLINKFNLNKDKINYNSVGFITILINSIIISLTGTVCTMIKIGYFWQLAIAFVMLMILIVFSYGILGKILKRKEVKNELSRNRKKMD